ncbi:hypothetical protein D3C79_1070860 [compost metagenome]
MPGQTSQRGPLFLQLLIDGILHAAFLQVFPFLQQLAPLLQQRIPFFLNVCRRIFSSGPLLLQREGIMMLQEML